MTRTTKTGSSRRKGDEYQDLTALQLTLEAYIDVCDFQILIEYKKAGSFDDVVVVRTNSIDAYQIKHAVSENGVYVEDDFTDKDSVVFFEKFTSSWKKLSTDFPDHCLTVHLRSNRSLDAQLVEVVNDEGFFDEMFRENRYRKEKRQLRSAIFESTGLSEDEFKQFLCSFHFDLKQPSWLQLEKYIQGELLDHKLGVSDRRVFSDLKRLVEHHAIESAEPITPKIIDAFLRKTQNRYLLSQSFVTDKKRFVNPPTLTDQLDEQLRTADADYVVVTGPPGSGKSTALTEYCDAIEENLKSRFTVVRYYCFVRVEDNQQRLRVEANSLRVNLLTELQRSFPNVLDERRFDFSESRFYEALEAVGNHCGKNQKKLVVLLDGLDHVERDDEVRDSVITALPSELPQNVVILIGTQELNRWTPLALKKGREKRHVEMPLFSPAETRTYVVDRCGVSVTDETLQQVFEKSAGLPLYLRYLVEILSLSEDPVETIGTIPPAVDGNVRTYYETLWEAFEADSRSDTKYLSSVLASLRFSVHEDELKAFQAGISDTPRFEVAYRRVRHLLRTDNSLVTIFHNSFRVFVLEHTSPGARKEIALGILSRLKLEELESPRWFKYAFRYALESNAWDYVLANINRNFVDAALCRFRSEEEIADGIDCAIEAAGLTSDLVALSRLGSLKYRTNERLEYTFSWSVLTDILLYEGRVDQVIDTIYSNESGAVIAGEAYSLEVILKLVSLGRNDLAEDLFDAYRKTFRGRSDLDSQGVIILARCLGVFKTRSKRVLEWLADTKLQRDILEPEEISVEYAPHLAAYLDGLVSSHHDKVWSKLKEVESPFSNQLIRQLTTRAVANWRTIDELRSEVQEYVVNYSNDTNVELAFYAAKAGFPTSIVNQLAGQFAFPPQVASHGMTRTELQSHILRFAYWTVIFGYEQNDAILRQLRSRVCGAESVWACTKAHLLKVGEVLGSHFADREIDWFCCATEAIEALEVAENVAEERTPDALDASRFILDRSLRWLGEVIVERCDEKVDEWATLLKRLRSSFVWTCHYGYGEAETNYSFEFDIWKKQTELPSVKASLRQVFVDCAESYDKALRLKGGLRGDHFLNLAALAAQCGFKSDSSVWLKRGIETSLAYGYRKDVTLENLTDVLTLLGKHRPWKVLLSAAEILEMVKWVYYATDGSCTTHFAQHLLPTIIACNRAAALEVLRDYYGEFARWQGDESVSKYILARKSGDPEFLWALCGLLDPNKSLEPRRHIASIAASSVLNLDTNWTSRLSGYIKTMTNPRYWPSELWNEAAQIHTRPIRKQRYENPNLDNSGGITYTLDGQQITRDEARQRCSASFGDMVDTLRKLKEENDYFSDYDLWLTLPDHIANAKSINELGAIQSFFEEHGRWREASVWEQIGIRYLRLGNTLSGLECLERAIHEDQMSNALVTLIEYDRDRAEACVVRNLTKSLSGASYHGFNAPNIAANLCDLLDKEESLEEVFDDFLHHCQELFEQWPDERSFEKLRNWSDDDRDEDVQIIHLLIDQLDAHAAEFGDRLVCSICTLAENRGDKVFPVLAERLASAKGLQLWRLLQVFARLSHSERLLFQKHCHCLIPLFNRGDSFLTLVASRAIRRAFEGEEPVPRKLEQAVKKVSDRYSSMISYRGHEMLMMTPSYDFIELTKKAAQVPFGRQLEALSEILDLDLDSLTALLEQSVLESGTTLEEVKDVARSMGTAYSNAQGWPVIWFVSDFHVQISELLYQAIDGLLTKQRYQLYHLEAVWRVIQPNDPEYSFSELSSMPEDISPLFVESKDDWITDYKQDPVVTAVDQFDGDWISAFEFRQIAQDNPYNREFVTQTHVRSALIVPEIVDDIASVHSESWEERVLSYHPAENLTWQQFRNALLEGHQLEPDGNTECLPFASYSEKHVGFLGFHTIASLSSKIIRNHDLRMDGFSVFAGKECVAHYEAWQEGYSDEDYSDDALSFGVRLRVSTQFVENVCQSMGRIFAIRTIENRFVLEDYQSKPQESRSILSVCVFPKGN